MLVNLVVSTDGLSTPVLRGLGFVHNKQAPTVVNQPGQWRHSLHDVGSRAHKIDNSTERRSQRCRWGACTQHYHESTNGWPASTRFYLESRVLLLSEGSTYSNQQKNRVTAWHFVSVYPSTCSFEVFQHHKNKEHNKNATKKIRHTLVAHPQKNGDRSAVKRHFPHPSRKQKPSHSGNQSVNA